jgi:phosphoribosylanthranilate isomerase
MAAEITRPWVKVCGITRPDDAIAAADAGASAIGLVEWPRSPRAVTVEQGRAVVDALAGRAAAVAVLVDRDPALVARFANAVGAQLVQLCGAERPEDFRGFDLPILRRVGVDDRAEDEIAAWRDIAVGFVLDHPSAPGGTGRAIDLDRATALAALAPCLLAGGLDEHVVAARVARVRPLGADASSRLESAPGSKDPYRVVAFVRAAVRALKEVTP